MSWEVTVLIFNDVSRLGLDSLLSRDISCVVQGHCSS